MSITRANLETVLVARCGALMTFAGLAATVVGTNADLNDPLAGAMRQAGYSLASPITVTDADLTSVADADLDKLLDLAEMRLLESIAGNLDDVDIRVGQRDEKLSQVAQNLEKRMTRLSKRITDRYGIGAASLEAGYITLDFADHNDTLPGEVGE